MAKIRVDMDDFPISVHDESSRLLSVTLFEDKPKAFKRIGLKSFVLGVGVALSAMPIRIVKAEQEAWLGVRDDLLENSELMQFHCDRGAEDNKKGSSAFNNDWVKQTNMLRFEAGVARSGPAGSNGFFSGLSMAMKSRCPGVW